MMSKLSLNRCHPVISQMGRLSAIHVCLIYHWLESRPQQPLLWVMQILGDAIPDGNAIDWFLVNKWLEGIKTFTENYSSLSRSKNTGIYVVKWKNGSR